MRKPSTAFVVEIDDDRVDTENHLHGRVEHVVSGAAHEFESARALIAFIEQVLQPHQPRPVGAEEQDS